MSYSTRPLARVFVALVAALVTFGTAAAYAQTDKPNILVIMGDDVGIPNLSVYSHGMMGYQTPNNAYVPFLRTERSAE